MSNATVQPQALTRIRSSTVGMKWFLFHLNL